MTESLKRLRAKFVYDEVRSWGRLRNTAGKAATRAKGLPVQVRTQGLGTTVAMLMHQARRQEEKKTDAGMLAEVLAKWLLDACPRRPFADVEVGGDDRVRVLLDACMRADRACYAAAQNEALAVLEDVKVLAQALYEDEP